MELGALSPTASATMLALTAGPVSLRRQGLERGGQRFEPRAASLEVAACSKPTSWLRTISPLSPCRLRLTGPGVVVTLGVASTLYAD